MSEVERRPILTPLSMVTPEVPRWAWQDRVPIGGLTIFSGTGGIGKSTVLAWLTAGWSNGTLAGDLEGSPCNVLLVATEDHLASVLTPRLIAAGCDTERVTDLKIGARDGSDNWTENPTIAQDLNTVRQAVEESATRVLIVDPVVSMQSGNSNDLADVRRDLNRLAGIAYDLDLAVILVHHWNKGQGGASSRMSGSHAYRDSARSSLALAEDLDTDQRVLTVEKSNYANTREIPSLAFAIHTVDLDLGNGQTARIGRADCLGETDVTVDEVATRSEPNLGATAQDILELASERETITAKDVEELLGCTAGSARSYLNRLVKKDHLERVRTGTYQITENGRLAGADQNATNATARQRDTGLGTVTVLHPKCPKHPDHPTYAGDCARCAADRNGNGTATDSDGTAYTVTGYWCGVCGWPTTETIPNHPNCEPAQATA